MKEKRENKLVNEILESQKLQGEMNGKISTAEELDKARKKAKRTVIFRALFIVISVLVIAIIFLVEFKNNDLAGLGAVIKNSPKANLLWGAGLCLVVCTIIQTLRMSLISKEYTGKLHPILSYKVTAVARYYDNLTPSSIGGQPAQIYYLHKNGISGSNSSGMTVVYFLAFQFAYIILGLITFIADYKMLTFGALNYLGYFGLLCHGIMPAMIIIVSLNKNVGKKILTFVINVGTKFRLIKAERKDALIERSYQSLTQYADKLSEMFRHFFSRFLPAILLTVLELLTYASIAYFTVTALGGSTEYGWFDYITIYFFTHSISAIMPTPGMTGGAEVVFMTAFGIMLSGSPLFWAMVIWRFFTFYFYLLQGIIITIVDNVKSSLKSKREIVNSLESKNTLDVSDEVVTSEQESK